MLYLLLIALGLPAFGYVDADCFNTDGNLYGVKKGSPVSDAPFLRSSSFDPKSKVHQIKACGKLTLTGLQLILLRDYEAEEISTLALSQLGDTTDCETWQVP